MFSKFRNKKEGLAASMNHLPPPIESAENSETVSTADLSETKNQKAAKSMDNLKNLFSPRSSTTETSKRKSVKSPTFSDSSSPTSPPSATRSSVPVQRTSNYGDDDSIFSSRSRKHTSETGASFSLSSISHGDSLLKRMSKSRPDSVKSAGVLWSKRLLESIGLDCIIVQIFVWFYFDCF